jgi:hypothetical protein
MGEATAPQRADLFTTSEAAARVGVAPRSFKTWAYRRGIRPMQRHRVGSTTVALWSRQEVLDGMAQPATRRLEW